MTDDELADRVLTYLEEGLTRLVSRPGSRPNLEAFLRGEAVFVVSRTEAVVMVPPLGVRTDLGDGN